MGGGDETFFFARARKKVLSCSFAHKMAGGSSDGDGSSVSVEVERETQTFAFFRVAAPPVV